MEYALLAASAAVSFVANALGRLRRARPPRILVVKLDHLGDVVTATPVFRALRDAFPTAPIDALVGPWGREVLLGNPHVSRVLVYDSPRFRRNWAAAPHGGARERGGASARVPVRAEAFRAIAAERYTHVIELRGDARTLLLPFRCRALRRVDRGSARVRSWLARRGLLPSGGGIAYHEVESNLAVVRPLLNGREALDRVEIFVSDDERRAARGSARLAGIDPARLLVVLHPGASWRPRAWRTERFAEVARSLYARHGVAIAFVGSREEADLETALRAAAPELPAAYVFDAPLRETLALIAEAALFIGNDSGLAHAAAAVGTPVVALFGPQDPRRFGPWTSRAIVLHKPVPCFPCPQTRCLKPDLPCVNLNTVEEVNAAAARLLPAERP